MARVKSAPRQSTAADEGTAAGKEVTMRPTSTISSTTTLSRRPGGPTSKLPRALHFPLVVVLSMALSALGYSTVNQWTRGEMAAVARTLEGNWEVSVLAGWRVLELALGWFANFDSYDLAALSVLSRGPSLYLLSAFYGIQPQTAGACLAVDAISNFLPFILLRPLSGAHAASPSLPNRELVVDKTIQAYTTLLAGAVYCVTLSTAYMAFLPRILVVYFNDIPTIEPAYSATSFLFVSLPTVGLCLLFGLAARTFIFAPTATTGHVPSDDRIAEFDPASATLGETLWWNFLGYTAQTKVAAFRTAVLMFIAGVNTYLQCSLTVRGVEPYGAAVYASVWVLAAFLTGVGLGVVGTD